MSAEAMKWNRTQMPRTADGKRDTASKAILFALCDRHSPTHDLFPGQGILSRDTGLSKGTVGRKLAILEGQGYIQRQRRYNRTGGPARGQRTTDNYTLNFSRPPDDLDSRERQPSHLRRQTENDHATTNPDRTAPMVNNARGDYHEEYPARRHSRASSDWTTTDLLDEVDDRFLWAFDHSPLNREAFAAHLAAMRLRLGRAEALERLAITDVFETEKGLTSLGPVPKTAPLRILAAIAKALIAGREDPEYPHLVGATQMVDGKYECPVGLDGEQFARAFGGRRARDEHDLRLEHARLGLT